MAHFALFMLLAVLIDRLFGYPNWLFGLIRHPVVWIGDAITVSEKLCRRIATSDGALTVAGILMAVGLTGLSILIAAILSAAIAHIPGGVIIEAILAASLLAQHSLQKHVQAVSDGLRRSLDDGRSAVSQIVGRDPAELDESEVSKAAIESLAENFSDGVIAPLFWGLLFGLPGIVGYKTINTLDSMVGYKNERYLHFGRFAARLDDLVNLPASRLTAGLLAVASASQFGGKSVRRAWQSARQFAPDHQSPNAGWPEAAMAGALEIQLGGPRTYGGSQVDLAAMGDGRSLLEVADIDRALSLYDRSLAVMMIVCVIWLAMVRLI
jgi:adenosylcobinamide-phosphate synthase